MDDNTINISDIINALTTIRDICKNNERCAVCPLYSDNMGICNIKHIDPENWELSSSYVWRAFK